MAKSAQYSGSVHNASDEYLGGSDEVKDCEHCQKRGNTTDATKYCTDCEEYLCNECSTSHTLFKAFQRHVLTDIIGTHCEPCQKGGRRTRNAVKYCLYCSEIMCKKCSKLHLRFKLLQDHVIKNIEAVSPVTTGSSTKVNSKPTYKKDELHTDQKRSTSAKSTPRTIKNVTAGLVSTIDITTSKDVNKPNIGEGGLTVVQTHYCVVTDCDNKCIKVVDTRNAVVTSEVDLTEVDSLWALASVNDDQVAVSARINDDEKLLFLSVSSVGIISKTYHSIGVKLPFLHSIWHCNDHFYASEVFSNTIYVVNTQGQKITTITNESFDDLTGIAVSNDHNTIYVCSNGNDTVFSLDLNGKVKATYKDKNLKEPEGVTVDAEGYVYVCSAGTKSVLKLSADISVGHVIISDVSLLSCAFNKIDNRLYLGQGRTIKVYEV